MLKFKKFFACIIIIICLSINLLFCLKYNIHFTFRYCAFRHDTLTNWFQSPFEKLFDIYLDVDNNYLLILMLIRIIPYCNTNQDRTFLLKWINKLWM